MMPKKIKIICKSFEKIDYNFFFPVRNTQPEKKFGDLWFEKVTAEEQEFVRGSAT